MLSQLLLQPTDIMLKTYTGEPLAPEWLRIIKLNLKDIHAREQSGNDNLGAVLTKHSAVFSKEFGSMKGIKARLILRPDNVAKFCSPCNMPYAL